MNSIPLDTMQQCVGSEEVFYQGLHRYIPIILCRILGLPPSILFLQYVKFLGFEVCSVTEQGSWLL